MVDNELLKMLNECAEKLDFDGAFKLVRENKAALLEQKVSPKSIADALKKTTKDRLLNSFIDGVDFAGQSLDESFVRLEKLISFKQGTLVLNKTWGLGKVTKVDYFYKRITVDFKTRKGHQFTYAAATDMLTKANDDHILVLRESDPVEFERLLKERPGDLVKKILASNGSAMTLIRLEDYCIVNGFVKAPNWKAFWDRARTALKGDKLVEIPAKKAEPIQLRVNAEDYGDDWLKKFAEETDPKLILSAVLDYESQGKLKGANDDVRTKVGERLAFAITAVRKVDDALYARLACLITRLGFVNPAAEAMRGYLWERHRYISAATLLPAREVGAMVGFLACDDEAKAKLYKTLPDFCFAAVTEIINQFGQFKSEQEAADETVSRQVHACRAAVAELMRQPKAPATLTTLLIGKYENFIAWKELPPLMTLLNHAIALGEGRQSGETLRMQNLIRRLFGNTEWLKKVFDWLQPDDKVMFFERFQASIAWDPSTHHTIVVRMTKLVPELESHVVKVEKKKEYARITSVRSFAMKKAEYLKLINEDMPANVKRIEFAKSYGDLSENAEYQYAKDEQRALMQKQTLMQADLEAVKPAEFADATTDEVMPGVTVVIDAAGGEKTYTILGEWDNDLERGILSSKTRVAQNLLGKKVGDSVELPDADGKVSFATVKAILPLSDAIREWMKLPEGLGL